MVAIVALVIAISANSSTNDNEKITNAVRAEEGRQIGGVRADLQKNVAAATLVLKRLQHSSASAHRQDAALRRDVNTAENGVLRNGSRIGANQASIANAPADDRARPGERLEPPDNRREPQHHGQAAHHVIDRTGATAAECSLAASTPAEDGERFTVSRVPVG